MLIRALILLLVVLNLGVAAWWLMSPPPPASAPAAQVDGLPLLETPTPQQLAQARRAAASRPAAEAPPAPQLVEARPTTSVAAAPTPQAKPVAPPKPSTEPAPVADAAKPASPICASLGPFDSEAEARAAQGRLKPSPTSARLRSQNQPARAYSVMAPFADRAAAEDMARRISAAGFDDLMVISNGPTSGVALGRYSTREAAQRRQRDLEAAGFDARMEAVGPEGPVQWWIDVRTSVPAAALQGQAGAARAVAQDCARASG